MTYKILIVDDEPVNLRTLSRLLRANYDVVTAESGDEALKLLQQHNVALLISDQRMPGMTGIELMKSTVALRPQMVKILLTGYTDVDALIESINCGLVYRYLTKPWNNDDLKLTIVRALAVPGARCRRSSALDHPSMPAKQRLRRTANADQRAQWSARDSAASSARSPAR